jgi:hypothetical protein
MTRPVGAVVQDDAIGPRRSLDVQPLWAIDRASPD